MATDEGRTDKVGNKEFLIEVTGGPKKYYNRIRRKNPFFQEPKEPIGPRITEQSYHRLIKDLRQFRLEQRLSQKVLAKKLGSSQSVISKFELGYTNPTVDFLVKYSQALGKNINFTVM